jgi:hypothetical protein
VLFALAEREKHNEETASTLLPQAKKLAERL